MANLKKDAKIVARQDSTNYAVTVDTLQSFMLSEGTIGDLKDVEVSGVQDGNTLTYNATAGEWRASEVITSAISFLQNEIIELEEEIEALAPTTERGKWVLNLAGTVDDPGQFTMYDGAYGAPGIQPNGKIEDVESIWFNEIDTDGTEHGFAGVEENDLIELFVDGAPEYGLWSVVGTPHYETAGTAQFWVIDVNFQRTLADGTSFGNDDLCRLKIFKAPEGGSASEFVLKDGDNMTGDLTLGTNKITLNATTGSASFAADATINSVTVGRGGVEIAGTGNRLLLSSSTDSSAARRLSESLSFNYNKDSDSLITARQSDLVLAASNNIDFQEILRLKGSDGSASFAQDATINGVTVGLGGGYSSQNTAVGNGALRDNTSGYSNTAVGREALNTNTEGSYNTAVGRYALYNNTTGNLNTAVGRSAGRYIEGDNNTILGAYQGTEEDKTLNNTVIISAGTTERLRIDEDGNTEFKGKVTSTSTEASDPGNTLVTKDYVDISGGGFSGDYNDLSNKPTIGNGTITLLQGSTTKGTFTVNQTGNTQIYLDAGGGGGGSICDCAGDAYIHGLTVGRGPGGEPSNTAFGIDALARNMENSPGVDINFRGKYNTAVGYNALSNNYQQVNFNSATTGNANTALGHNALGNNTFGSGNIGIGGINSAGSYAPVFSTTTENNRIVMGSTSVTNAYVQVAWTVVSDARDKTNFAPVPHGLDFVKQLEPTQYEFRVDRDSDEVNGPIHYGFKAQDILALEGDHAVIIDAEDPEHLKYKGEHLVPVLVNAIKEQQVLIDKQQVLIDALTARLDATGA